MSYTANMKKSIVITILVMFIMGGLWVWLTIRNSYSQLVEDPLSLQSIAEHSAVIVHGRVARTYDIIDDINGKQTPFKVSEIEPMTMIKGNDEGKTILVRALGGQTADGKVVFSSNSPVGLSEGEEVVLFLELLGPSAKRYLSVTGANRGKYLVVDSAT